MNQKGEKTLEEKNQKGENLRGDKLQCSSCKKTCTVWRLAIGRTGRGIISSVARWVRGGNRKEERMRLRIRKKGWKKMNLKSSYISYF